VALLLFNVRVALKPVFEFGGEFAEGPGFIALLFFIGFDLVGRDHFIDRVELEVFTLLPVELDAELLSPHLEACVPVQANLTKQHVRLLHPRQRLHDSRELGLGGAFRKQQVWEGVRKSLAATEGPEVELLDGLVVRQLEVDEVELAEVAHNDFSPLGVGHVHHENNDFGDLLLHAVEHLLDDLNGLVRQKLTLMLLLVLKGATPNEEPSHEHIRLQTLSVVASRQLLAPVHLNSVLGRTLDGCRRLLKLLLARLSKLQELFSFDEIFVEEFHHELLVQELRHDVILVKFANEPHLSEAGDFRGVDPLMGEGIVIESLLDRGLGLFLHNFVEGVDVDQALAALVHLVFVSESVWQAPPSLVYASLEHAQVCVVFLEDVPLDEAFKKRHRGEVPQKAPRLGIVEVAVVVTL